MHVLFPFITYADNNPDFNEADSLAEAERLFQRQTVIEAVLQGKEHPDVMLDMLEEHGIDAAEYVESAEEGVDLVIANQIPIEEAEFLLHHGTAIS